MQTAQRETNRRLMNMAWRLIRDSQGRNELRSFPDALKSAWTLEKRYRLLKGTLAVTGAPVGCSYPRSIIASAGPRMWGVPGASSGWPAVSELELKEGMMSSLDTRVYSGDALNVINRHMRRFGCSERYARDRTVPSSLERS